MLRNWISSVFVFLVLSCAKDPADAIRYQVVISPEIGGTVSTTGGTYESGSEITVTATAKDGFRFEGWEGTASGQTNPLTITISGDTNIKAIFTSIKYSLRVDIVGKGGVSKKEVILSRDKVQGNKTSEEYNAGSVVRLDAIADNNWIFYRWSGAVTSTEKQADISIYESKVVTATFEERVSTADIIKVNLAGVLENGFHAVGKWKIRRPREEESVGDARFGIGTSQCQISEVVFRTDGSFTITFVDSSIVTGFFNPQKIIEETFDIFLTTNNKNFGVLRNLTVTNNYINFTYESEACVTPSPIEGDRDRTYVEADDPNAPTSNECKVISLLGTGPQVQIKTQNSPIDRVTFPFYSSCNNELRATAVNLPEGVTMSFNNNEAVISGIPTENASGTYNYVIRVQSTVTSVTIAGVIKVNHICYTLGVLTASGSDHQTVSQNIPIDDIVYSLTNKCNNLISTNVSGLPPGVGMTFSNSQAIISGTPTTSASGTYNYVVTASDISTTTEISFTGVIEVITTCSIKGVFSGLPTQTVTQTTAITSITYTFISSCGGILTASVTGLPDGVTMDFTNNKAIISGRPTTAASSGTYNYVITVNDSLTTSTFSGRITVVGFGSVECPISALLIKGLEKQTVEATNAISPITYIFASCGESPLKAIATGLPPGVVMTFNNLFGQAVISGTPTSVASGTYNYNITINDTSRSVIVSGSINVLLPPICLSFSLTNGLSSTTVLQSTVVNDIVYTLSKNSASCGVASVTSTGLPDGVNMAYYSTTDLVVISGTPTVAGTYNYTLKAIDSNGKSITVIGTIIVNACKVENGVVLGQASQTVLQGSQIIATTYNFSSNCSKTLSANIDSINKQLPPGVSASFDSSNNRVTVSGTVLDTATAGAYTYGVVVTNNSTSTTVTGTITVNACKVESGAVSGQLSQTVSQGGQITTTTYNFSSNCSRTLSVNTDNINKQLPPGVSASFDSSNNRVTVSGTILGTATTGAYTYDVIVTDNIASTKVTGTITVSIPCKVLRGIVPDSPPIFIYKNLSTAEYNFSSSCSLTLTANTDAINTQLPTGLTAAFSANKFTISGVVSSTVATGNYEFKIVVSDTRGNKYEYDAKIVVLPGSSIGG